MRRMLIHIDLDRNQAQASLDLLNAAEHIVPNEPLRLHALVINGDVASLVGKVDVAFDLQDDRIKPQNARAICSVIAALHEKSAFDAILMADDCINSQVASRLAVRIDAGLITEVITIASENGRNKFIRRVCDGAAEATFETCQGHPVILTVKTARFRQTRTSDRDTKIVKLETLVLPRSGIRQIEKRALNKVEIQDADILLSGGRGVAKDFSALEPLAALLGGAVSASRAVVDAGIADRNQQVGQTGKRVAPRLYMALGINGAIQHVQGLQQAEHIISVNTNVNAPICSLSDIVMEGDALTFVDKLLNKIKEEQSNGNL